MRRYIEVPFQLLTIEDEGFHVMVKGKINDMEANFLIDTGASQSIFSLTAINTLIGENALERKPGITAGVGSDNLESFLCTLDKLSIGDIHLDRYDTVAIDLSSIHENYAKLGLPTIDGIIGGDLLVKLKASINYRLRKIRLTPPRSVSTKSK